MACSKTRRIGNKDWPLYRTTNAGLCCYKVVVATSADAAVVVADAEAQPDYVKRSRFFEVPEGIQFYLYFREK
jgi:hypothetical protein